MLCFCTLCSYATCEWPEFYVNKDICSVLTAVFGVSYRIQSVNEKFMIYTCMDINYRNQIKFILTLKASITTAADDKFCEIFPNFPKK